MLVDSKVLQKLVERIKDEEHGIENRLLVEALLASLNKPTNYSGIFVNRSFHEGDMWRIVEEVLVLNRGITHGQFLAVKQVLQRIVEQEAGIELLDLGLKKVLGSRPPSSNYHQRKNQILNILYNECDVETNILSFVHEFEANSKRVLWVYLKLFADLGADHDNISPKDFAKAYETIFAEELTQPKCLKDVINNSRLAVAEADTRFVYAWRYPYVAALATHLKQEIMTDLRFDVRPIGELFENYESLGELAGMDYVLTCGDRVCCKQWGSSEWLISCETRGLADVMRRTSKSDWTKFSVGNRIEVEGGRMIISADSKQIEDLETKVRHKKNALLRDVRPIIDYLSKMGRMGEDQLKDEGYYWKKVKTPAGGSIDVIVAAWYLPIYTANRKGQVITEYLDPIGTNFATEIEKFDNLKGKVTLLLLKVGPQLDSIK